MNCFLHLMSLCLFDSSAVYLTGEMVMAPFSGYSNEYAYCGHVNRKCAGPIGIAKLGVRVQVTENWTLDYSLRHQSYIMENDRGSESFSVGLTWRPFNR